MRLEVDSSSAGYTPGEPREVALNQQIEERASALPGVKAASFSAFTFHEASWNSKVLVAGTNLGKDINVKHNVIGNGYFATMQIPLLAGRNFSTSDTSTSQHVAIISEHLAKILFPLGNPIGRHYGVDFEVHYTGSFAPIAAAVQQTIHSIDRSLPITGVTTLDEQVARTLTDQRLVAQLSTFFGLLAVFLSSIGIYGLMSYVLSRRTNEIGIRMALSAARANVRWLVMREILFMVAIGVAIGIPTALAGDRLVASMLFGVKSTDPASLLTAVALLLTVAVVAGYFPPRRASRVDPMEALRYE